MSDLHTCSRCLLPIHRDDAVAYLGDRVAHQYSRCVALQRAEIERLRAAVAMLLDCIVLPGNTPADEQWLDACLLSGRYCEPFLSAERQRARMPDDLVERLSKTTPDSSHEASCGVWMHTNDPHCTCRYGLLRDILAWHDGETSK